MDDSGPLVAGAGAGAATYLVPFRWWKEAQESSLEAAADGTEGIRYAAVPSPSSSTSVESDLVFELRREGGRDSKRPAAEDEGVSCRCYALIRRDMCSMAVRWHNGTILNTENYLDASDDMYPLTLRISASQDTSTVTIKICKEDNVTENYVKASTLFSDDSELVYIWDLSEQLDHVIMNLRNIMFLDGQHQSENEILLEIRLYVSSEAMTSEHETRKYYPTIPISQMGGSSYGGDLFMSNGSIETMDFDLHSNVSSIRTSSSGLTGLENLGNTCFMNSAIQCLAHTPELVRYFHGNYIREINCENPLGMNGELALAFGQLLRKLWAPGKTPIAPNVFKSKLSSFAPQFYGFSQHDCQELLAFLLDGLHEDLNRVKQKPYVEVKDASGRPDEEVAEEYWANHLARNDSIIVDICHGQYRSTLACPVCNKLSVTFDPFIYLSLPLPSTKMRTMTVTVFSTDGHSRPAPYTVNVPKSGNCSDLIQSLSIACSLKQDESLLVAEVFCNKIIRFLEDPSDSVSLIRDGDQLAAYRLSKELEEFPLIVYMHQTKDEHYFTGRWKTFGTPLVTRLPGLSTGPVVRDLFLKLLGPFLSPKESTLDVVKDSIYDEDGITNIDCDSILPDFEDNATVEEMHFHDGFQFYLTDENSQIMLSEIEMNEPICPMELQNKLFVLVSWHEKQMTHYNVSLLNTLPEVYKFGLLAKQPQESVSLYSCLEAFLKEEPLGPEDMWYCPSCKRHQQASKKLDLWRLPEVLIIHLKRFSYDIFSNNKLEMFVDFPIHDLDLSGYLACKSKEPSKYQLYAISNHYGNMGGGHYTAYVYHEIEDCWYDFDDQFVLPTTEDNIKSSAAYVLFYKRIRPRSLGT
ncbi:ubiquitin carboxyl-terminal hydrolase 8-like isoform X2 [Curcuma longa]|uniref:ubiquitin carboxyl-terminal hydrolase 8-like isoform X2 n=1 Tax=Curcuma longa TaxID=136217 RepID=UPI003D9E5A48